MEKIRLGFDNSKAVQFSAKKRGVLLVEDLLHVTGEWRTKIFFVARRLSELVLISGLPETAVFRTPFWRRLRAWCVPQDCSAVHACARSIEERQFGTVAIALTRTIGPSGEAPLGDAHTGINWRLGNPTGQGLGKHTTRAELRGPKLAYVGVAIGRTPNVG